MYSLYTTIIANSKHEIYQPVIIVLVKMASTVADGSNSRVSCCKMEERKITCHNWDPK